MKNVLNGTSKNPRSVIASEAKQSRNFAIPIIYLDYFVAALLAMTFFRGSLKVKSSFQIKQSLDDFETAWGGWGGEAPANAFLPLGWKKNGPVL